MEYENATITVKKPTHARLYRLKGPELTYDGFLCKVLDEYEENISRRQGGTEPGETNNSDEEKVIN
jgi:hypothetical protein